MNLTIVAPLYNEEESVARLYSSIVDAVGPEGYNFEVIFVDDGSRDHTCDIAADIAANDTSVLNLSGTTSRGELFAIPRALGFDRSDILSFSRWPLAIRTSSYRPRNHTIRRKTISGK